MKWKILERIYRGFLGGSENREGRIDKMLSVRGSKIIGN